MKKKLNQKYIECIEDSATSFLRAKKDITSEDIQEVAKICKKYK